MRIPSLLFFFLCLWFTSNAQIQPVQIEWKKHGGYVGCLDVEPGSPNHLLAAGGASGLWESFDGGRTWGHIDALEAYRLIAVSFCPTNSNIIFATSRFDTRTTRPSGIWRSMDKGRSWQNLPLPGRATANCPLNGGAYSISWVGRTDSLVVATDCGVAISPDKGDTWTIQTVNQAGMIPAGNRTPDAVYNVLALNGSRFIANASTGTYWTNNKGIDWTPCLGIPAYSGGSVTVSPSERKILFFYGYGSGLLFSSDLGVNWSPVAGYRLGENQPQFAKATPTAAGELHKIDVYVGDGSNFSRFQADTRNLRTISTPAIEAISLQHGDPQDIIFHPTTKRPYVVAGDGGIQLPTNEEATSWINVGGGRDGLNGLEVKGIGVQNVLGHSDDQTDLYVATWHNDVFWSPNGGRTWNGSTMVESSNLEANGPFVNTRDARISTHYMNADLKLFGRGYNEITTSFEPVFRQNVQGMYLRYFKKDDTECMLARTGDEYWMVPVGGGTWNRVYQFTPTARDAWLINAPSLSRAADGSVVMYQPYVTNTFGPFSERVRKLKRIVIRGTAVAPVAGTPTEPAMNGFTSLGQMQEFADKTVFAASPDNPQFLLAADVGDGKMKKSVTGGESWMEDPLLTALVTDYGRLQFYTTFPQSMPQAQVISFNPYNTLDIYVSTIEGGIIYSRDGGNSWTKIRGSEKVKLVNSIGFSSSGTVYFGSSARSVWKFNPNRLVRYPFGVVRDFRTVIRDRMTGAQIPIGDLGPDKCPACRIYLVRNGSIRNVQATPGGNTTVTLTDLRSLVDYAPDTSQAEAINFIQSLNLSSGVTPVIAQIEKAGFLVKGLITEHGKIRAFVTGDKSMQTIPATLFFSDNMLTKPERISLPSPPIPGPDKVYSTYQPVLRIEQVKHPDMALQPGSTLLITGSGFEPGNQTKNAATVSLGNTTKEISPNAKGNFNASFVLPKSAGKHAIVVVQHTAQGIIRQSKVIEVGNTDGQKKN